MLECLTIESCGTDAALHPEDSEWSYYSTVSWLLIYTNCGVRARSQEWLREGFLTTLPVGVNPSCRTSGGSFPAALLLWTVEDSASLVTLSPSPVWLCLSVSSSSSTSRGQASVKEEKKKKTFWESSSNSRKDMCSQSFQGDSQMPIMVCCCFLGGSWTTVSF